MNHKARYLTLNNYSFLKKIEQARILFSNCSLCWHKCRVNRSKGEFGICRAGADIEIAHHQIHFGEEPPFSNHGGAGAIFFTHCNLKCVYCQNFQISQQRQMRNSMIPERLASIMIELQNKGAQNIDLVSPTHFVPLIIEAIHQAKDKGLKLPIVYNTNAYDSPETLDLLSDIVDVYMPDFKYFEDTNALLYSGIKDYTSAVKLAVKIMHEQTGDFIMDQNGCARSGLFIRHLVLPENLAGSKDVLDFLREFVGLNIGLSIMSQYAPCYRAKEFKELNRKLKISEYEEVTDYVEQLGFSRCWIQRLQSNKLYFPDFESQKVF